MFCKKGKISLEQKGAKNNTIIVLIVCAFVFVVFVWLFNAEMLFPALNKAREKARRISCASNLHSMGLVFKQYAMDYKDHFPEKSGWEGWENLRANDYLTDYGIYICPSDLREKGKSGPLRNDNVSYVYLGGFMEKNFTKTEKAQIPLAFDIPSNHKNYINIVFIDGHIKGFQTKAKTCRELIAFLNQKFRYSPKHLKILEKKADIADRMYN